MAKTEKAFTITLDHVNSLVSQPAFLVLVVWFVLKF